MIGSVRANGKRAASPRAVLSGLSMAALVLIAGTACSRNDPGLPSNLNTTLPANRGASCVDPKGDISGDASKLGGSLSEPAGIDLVSAKATLTDTALQVEFNTAGKITGTPQPEFILDQGEAGQPGSWELKARQNSAGWELALTTWEKDSKGRFVENPGKILSAQVNVSDTKLSYEVAQKEIPPAATYVWLFGATSGTDPNTLLDQCDNAGGGSSGTTTPPATTPPTTLPVGSLRQSLTTKRGETITVYSVESPPSSPQAGATPPDPAPEQLPGEAAAPPFKLAVIDTKVCAPANQSLTTSNYFFVKDQNGTNWPVHAVATPAHEPALPEGSMTLPANDCKQGWATVQMPETSNVTQVIYSIDQTGQDALVWNA